MILKRICLLCIATCLLAFVIHSTAWAKDDAADKNQAPDVMLPEIHTTEGEPLDVLVYSIRDKLGLNIVLVNLSGGNQITLPEMKLSGVSLSQFSRFLMNSYPVTVTSFDGPKPLYVFNVTSQAMPGAAAAAPVGGPPMSIKVYNLAPFVDGLASQRVGSESASPDEAMRKSLNDILSLIQAAMEQDSQEPAPTLKVHEPTRELIFKGSPWQQSILEELLSTLPTVPDEAAHLRELEDLRKRLNEVTAMSEQLEAVNRELQVRLSTSGASPTTQPAK